MKKPDLSAALPLTGNHLKLADRAGFASGQATGLLLTDKLGSGALRMKKPGEACFLTPVYRTEAPFNDLVASWNAETPAGSWLEVLGRLYLPEYDGWTDRDGTTHDGWTDWLSWGRWSTHIARCCPHAQDSHPRRDSEDNDGWAFAYSYKGAGDSSVNVRGELTATAFQLKAVLHAADDCQALPALRLLAATWKNTHDPDWQSKCSYPEPAVEPAPSVLLDTPAISQMARDPDYARVICSATTATMLMNARGGDLLPEDVTLLGYDHGFGGNGNWSFTCAAAGAYGYESYVSYSSFEAIRQEITRGYGVGLSVKYSDKEGDTVPYLENAPCRAPGHLIAIVGYYFSQELGEYVYCANDPAGNSDGEVAHREYRESQLDKCWYRRAAYFLHDRQPGAGLYVRDYVSATLMPVKDQPGQWALTTEDSLLRIPADFQQDKRKAFGQHGTICYYAEDERTAIPNTCKRVTANHVFRYTGISVSEDGYLSFADDALSRLLAQGKAVRLLVLDNCDTVYTASVTARELFDPADLVTPEEEARQQQTARLARAGAAAAGAVAVAAALAGVVHFLRRNKK